MTALLIIPNKDGNKDLTSLEQAEIRHKQLIAQRAELKPLAKNLMFDTFEHYTESVFDVGNIQCDIMKWIREGNPQDKVKGAITLEELKSNERLMNFVVDKITERLTRDKLPCERESCNLWNLNTTKSNKTEKEYCYFCKQYTNQYENTCPGCRNWSSNFEDRSDDKK